MNDAMKLLMRHVILVFALLHSQPLIGLPGQIERHVIAHPLHTGEEIEFFIQKPEGHSACPAMLLLHGYQPPDNSSGGAQFIEYGYLQRFVKEGIVAIAISIPGYGKSKGTRDFGGYSSQQAIAAVIHYVKDLPYVDPSKMGIYGISRGAQLAGMVTCHVHCLDLQILESGFYDLLSFQSDTPDYLVGIRKSIELEGGHSTDELIARSVIYHADAVKAATLILQGEFDDRRQLPAAQKLHDSLRQRGVKSLLKVYPNELHALPVDKWDTIIPFVREHFFELYGIGVKVSEATPAMQILKIHPDSPASHHEKIKVGDAILAISSNNDAHEISALHMPISQFTSLILGKKNTAVRLRVQHFDLSVEEIVITRG